MPDYFLRIAAYVAAITSASVAVTFFLLERRRRRFGASRDRILGPRYRAGLELGRGMNAVALRVQDTENPGLALVAKMLLTPDDEPRISRESFRRHLQRFRREMKNLERLEHSRYVIPMYGFYPNALQPYFVMPYCEGSLDDLIKRGPLSMEQVVEVLGDVCAGLADCHGESIIHRDLKPANILSYDGRWVLADFGMSLMGGDGTVVTVPESLPGTIPYTAPEVVYLPPEEVGPVADVFSLGVTLKQMLTAQCSWVGVASDLVPRRAGEETREEVTAFDDLIKRMMEFNPSDRPGSIHDSAQLIVQALEEVNALRRSGKSSRPELAGVDRILARMREPS